jgi:hypothetical protein
MARNYRTPTVSMRGVVIDMEALMAANESSRAVGNAGMNARGDVVGQGGKIEITREQRAREYYNSNPQTSNQVSLKPAMPDVFETPEQAVMKIMGEDSAIDLPKELGAKPSRRRLVDNNDD